VVSITNLEGIGKVFSADDVKPLLELLPDLREEVSLNSIAEKFQLPLEKIQNCCHIKGVETVLRKTVNGEERFMEKKNLSTISRELIEVATEKEEIHTEFLENPEIQSALDLDRFVTVYNVVFYPESGGIISLAVSSREEYATEIVNLLVNARREYREAAQYNPKRLSAHEQTQQILDKLPQEVRYIISDNLFILTKSGNIHRQKTMFVK
jgi:hypothetical protein